MKIKFSRKVLIIFLNIFGICFGSVISNGYQGFSHSENIESLDEVESIITLLMGNPAYCLRHFQNQVVPLAPYPKNVIPSVNLKEMNSLGALTSTSLFTIGTNYQNLLITSLQLNVNGVISANNYDGALDILITEKTGFNMSFKKSIPVTLATDALNRITECGLKISSKHGDNIGVYSDDCNDFASKGWISKKSCLQDGRVHTVHSGFGAASSELSNGIKNAAQIKLTYTNAAGAITVVTCNTSLLFNSLAFCSRLFGYSGSVDDNIPLGDIHNSFSGPVPWPESTWGHFGAPMVRSDGHTRGSSLIPFANDGVNTAPMMETSISVLPNLKWHVRY